MTKFKGLLLLLFVGFNVFGQSDDTWTAPHITDDMTKDPEQNEKWRSGDYVYSAKPKNAWELGLDLGHSFVSGDVNPNTPFGGFGLGLHVRKAINYVFSLQANFSYNAMTGYDARPTAYSTFKQENAFRSNSAFANYEGAEIYRNYQTKTFGGDIQAVLNLGNLLFHRERNKWNLNVGLGFGFFNQSVYTDLLDGNTVYNFASINSNASTKEGRRQARKDVKDLLDGDFETKISLDRGVFSLSDDISLRGYAHGSVGVSRKISKRFNVGLTHSIYFSDNDLLDGYLMRSQYDESTETDYLQTTKLSLNINLGSFDQKTEPLYWLNPISSAMNDLAEVKARPVLDLTDTDGDGVIDMIDQELNTAQGCPVNARGIAVDSDGDGIIDCDDFEPFTMPGLDVDANGVGIVEDEYLTKDKVNELIDDKLGKVKLTWFLPMIHFDLDKFRIKPQFYGQLHHVAEVLKTHPNISVVVKGYADNRNPSDYNQVLSYNRALEAVNYLVAKYGVDRSRLILQYAGEEQALVDDLPDTHSLTKQDEYKQYMNRRVEFTVAKDGDEEMPKPNGPEAGENTPGSSRSGSKYSGNPNSGY